MGKPVTSETDRVKPTAEKDGRFEAWKNESALICQCSASALSLSEINPSRRVDLTHEKLAAFAASLLPADQVVVQATDSAGAVFETLGKQAARVAVAAG